jgi:hypothetical protein
MSHVGHDRDSHAPDRRAAGAPAARPRVRRPAPPALAHDRRGEARAQRHVDARRALGAVRPRPRRRARPRRRPRPRPVPALQGARADGVLRRARGPGLPRPGRAADVRRVRLAARSPPGPRARAGRGDLVRLARARAAARRRHRPRAAAARRGHRTPEPARRRARRRRGAGRGQQPGGARVRGRGRSRRAHGGRGRQRLGHLRKARGWDAVGVDGRDHAALTDALTRPRTGRPQAVVAHVEAKNATRIGAVR